MDNPRDILNELKWRHEKSLEKARIYYVHRGAPDDFRVMQGEDIEDLGRSFIRTEDAHIPYHRVFKIDYEGEVLLERDADR
ncbi:MAG: DUF504 domain-containing protein [Candidatus Natronoplasma sp.]